jgi:hypothetical protein
VRFNSVLICAALLVKFHPSLYHTTSTSHAANSGSADTSATPSSRACAISSLPQPPEHDAGEETAAEAVE